MFVLQLKYLDSSINNISNDIYLFTKDRKASTKKSIWSILFLNHEAKTNVCQPTDSRYFLCDRVTRNKQFAVGCRI